MVFCFLFWSHLRQVQVRMGRSLLLGGSLSLFPSTFDESQLGSPVGLEFSM